MSPLSASQRARGGAARGGARLQADIDWSQDGGVAVQWQPVAAVRRRREPGSSKVARLRDEQNYSKCSSSVLVPLLFALCLTLKLDRRAAQFCVIILRRSLFAMQGPGSK